MKLKKEEMKSTDFPHTYCQWSLVLLGRSNSRYTSKVISILWSNLTSFLELLHLWTFRLLYEEEYLNFSIFS